MKQVAKFKIILNETNPIRMLFHLNANTLKNWQLYKVAYAISMRVSYIFAPSKKRSSYLHDRS